MIITDEMKTAIDLIATTNQALYITGKAGTGKTTFLRYIVQNIPKRFIISASTGIAAINAGGVTLHSLFMIPLGITDPTQPIKIRLNKQKRDLLRSIDALVIDEISMVRADTLDFIDRCLRHVRKNREPFGGMQIIMFGDLYQLPPVVKKNEEDVLRHYYLGPHFFYAHVFRESSFKVIELTQIFRQSDPTFIQVLNNIRSYQVTADDMDVLGEIRNRSIVNDYDNNYIHICSLKRDVQKINSEMLGEATHKFYAKFAGDFNPSHAPCDVELSLRIGARVMILVNNAKQGYYNGSLGNVVDITDKAIEVELDDDKSIVSLEPFTWDMVEYKVEKGCIKKNVKGTCTQFPVSLAWAITIHKSQGLTFDRIAIHSKYIFAPGQLYVALSRCTSLEGIASDSFISKKQILPDQQLLKFESAYQKNDHTFDSTALSYMQQ